MENNLSFRHALLPSGWAQNVVISIKAGLINEIEVGAEVAGSPYGIALPGMVNLHSHSFQRAMAGLTEIRGAASDSFWTWRNLMYRFALRMTPDDVAIVAAQAFIEMLEGGFTHVAEFHYLHHAPNGEQYQDIAEIAARIAGAAAAVGIDLTLLPVFYAHAGFGGLPPAPMQRRFINSLDSYARLYERCAAMGAVGVAPHSLRAVTVEELVQLVKLADTKPVHIHISEQTAEVDDCVAWSGARPVAYLLDHAPVGKTWCLVHATHADVYERAGITAAEAVVGLCPITEANLGDGIFPAREFSGTWGVGSDSNVLIGVADELRMLEYSQRLLFRQRNVMASETYRSTATSLYQAGLSGGAQAVSVGCGLAAGQPANVVALAGDEPEVALARWIFAERKPQAPDVWVRGKKCVTAGQHRLAQDTQVRFDAVVQRLLLGDT